MNCSLLLTLGTILICAQPSDETQRAIAAVLKAEGKVVIDRKAPGEPVVSVNL